MDYHPHFENTIYFNFFEIHLTFHKFHKFNNKIITKKLINNNNY